MRALQGGTRIAFLGFFASHIIFTLLIDVQALFKPYYPQMFQDLLTWYADTLKDPLMSEPFDLWLQSMIVFELLIQLPYFFVAVKMLSDSTLQEYPRWFQLFSIIYGSHTATTLVPILPTIWFREEEEAPFMLRLVCLSIYLPYLLFPLGICYIAATTDSSVGATAGTKKIK
jgi:hypothetical protein